MDVEDLNLDEDIIPLFNYTNNQHAELELYKILKEPICTPPLASERQAICKGFISNWAILEDFSYQVLNLKESYAFLTNIAENKLLLGKHTLRTKVQLQLSEKERSQRRSQLVQVVLLLERIYSKFLSRIDKNKFPLNYQTSLGQSISFLRKLRLEYFAHAINEDKFSVARMVEILQLFATLDKKEITSFWKFFFLFEAHYSIAKASIKHNFVFASFDEDIFHISDFYHPIVEQPVKNSIEVKSGQHVILLTGPNMSGKSTLLKSIGLCVYLSHIGLAVPATTCTIPYFDSINIAINSQDNLQSGYSHFMAEIQHLKAVLEQATVGKNCFAIFDELFKGTNIDDAQEITLSTVKGLTKFKGSLFFISTHLLHLEEQIPNHEGNIKKCYIDCSLKEGIPIFNYKLKEGWSTIKIGKVLFEMEGLSKLLK